MDIPTKEQCLELLRQNNVLPNILRHCMAVHDFGVKLADRLDRQGIAVNTRLVAAGCLLHDIEKLKPQHELKGHDLVRKAGYPEVAVLIKTHGL